MNALPPTQPPSPQVPAAAGDIDGRRQGNDRLCDRRDPFL